MTAQTNAEHVGLSATVYQKRLQRLRTSGVIESKIASLSLKTVGKDVTAIVQVLVSRDRTEDLDRFKRTMLDAPEVMKC